MQRIRVDLVDISNFIELLRDSNLAKLRVLCNLLVVLALDESFSIPPQCRTSA
jgi:hypothetical protein